MKINTMGRHFREASKNLIRNGWMTFASLSAVTITLLILGVSLVLALNAERLSTYVAGQLRIDVFLKMDVNRTEGHQIQNAVASLPGVKSVQYVTREEGFKQLQQELGPQYSNAMSGLSEENTLPDKLVVEAKDPQQQLTISKEIQAIPGVDTVNDGKQYVDKFFHFMDTVRNIGLVFVVALLVTAMFLISNTIKITIFSRRREIEIMKLVGATNWFIRWPFMVEALIIGVVGALIPFGVLMAGYSSIYARLGGTFQTLTFPLITTRALAGELFVVLFGLGLVIGLWGGAMSLRKFLKI